MWQDHDDDVDGLIIGDVFYYLYHSPFTICHVKVVMMMGWEANVEEGSSSFVDV